MKVALVLLAVLNLGASLKVHEEKPGDALTYWEGWPQEIYPNKAPKQAAKWDILYEMKSVLDVPLSGCQICSMVFDHVQHEDEAPCKANFYYPVGLDGSALPGKIPLVSFVHGNQHGGALTNDAYAETIFKPLVGAGYAIVATQSIGNSQCKDMLPAEAERALTWLKSSTYSQMVDWEKVGLTGYSLGGRTTLDLAADDKFVRKWNVKFAAPLMPWCSDAAECAIPVVPTLYGEAFRDQLTPWCYAFPSYDQATIKDKYWQRIPDTTHKEVGPFGKNQHMPCVRRGLDCHVRGDAKACQKMSECSTPISEDEQKCGDQAKETWW